MVINYGFIGLSKNLVFSMICYREIELELEQRSNSGEHRPNTDP